MMTIAMVWQVSSALQSEEPRPYRRVPMISALKGGQIHSDSVSTGTTSVWAI